MESKMGKKSLDDDDEFMMPDDKVRQLARLVHLQEAQRISTIQFQSVYHRIQYLRDSRETYDLAVGILDSGHKLTIKHQDDEVTGPLAHKAYSLSKLTVGSACRLLWNLNLRNSYLQKIRAYAQEKEQQITKLYSDEALSLEEKVKQARGIVEELAQHKNLAYDFMRSRQNPASRYSGYWLGRRNKLAATTFDHMVYKYQAKLAKTDPSFTGRFEDLGLPKDGEVIELEDLGSAGLLKKAEVYEDIVKSSGLGTHDTLVKVGKGAGAALILFQLGMIAWDTYSSDHPFQTLAKDSMETAASLGGGVFGEIIGSAVASSIVASAGVVAMTTAATAFVVVASVVGGFVGGIVVGAIAGWFLDKLFETGGKEAHKHVDRHPTTEHLVVHVAPMPNGDRLARQITAASN